MAETGFNINAVAAKEFYEQVKKDPQVARKQKKVEGMWNFVEGQPQFRAELETPKGKVAVNCELPPFAGGWGASPDPIQYCLFGMAACYATTFMSVAAQEGVPISALRVRAENEMDLAKQLGIGHEPIVKKIRFVLHAEGPTTSQLTRLKSLADERCPGVECVTRSIPLETTTE